LEPEARAAGFARDLFARVEHSERLRDDGGIVHAAASLVPKARGKLARRRLGDARDGRQRCRGGSASLRRGGAQGRRQIMGCSSERL
jgi:hypothetical protein